MSCSLARQFLRLLVILGALLLGYVVAQYGEMYLKQRRLAREWQRQQQAHQAQAAGAKSTATSYSEEDGLTRLSVPRIDLDSVVVEGTNRKALLLGPGHMPNTPAPGASGNSVIYRPPRHLLPAHP